MAEIFYQALLNNSFNEHELIPERKLKIQIYLKNYKNLKIIKFCHAV
jgi:hypothetical protein